MQKEEIIKQAKELLTKLDDKKVGVDMLNQDKARLIDAAIPPDVKEALADIEAEFGDKLEKLNKEIKQLEDIVKKAAVQVGETIKTENIMVVYYKPRVTWNTDKLEGYMVTHPEIVQFRETAPSGSASIRKR